MITNGLLLKAEQKNQNMEEKPKMSAYPTIRDLQNGSPAISMKSYIKVMLYSVSPVRKEQETLYNISGNFAYICSNFLRVLVFRKSFLCKTHLHEVLHSLVYEMLWVPLDQ